MKDTAPEINARLFAAMMQKSPEERLLMGFQMLATARLLVWSGIPKNLSEGDRRSLFFERFYGERLPDA